MKTVRILSAAAALCLATFAFASCYVRINHKALIAKHIEPNGEIISKTISIEEGRDVFRFNGSFDIVMIQEEGPAYAEIEASSNIVEYLQVEYEDGDAVSVYFGADSVRSISMGDVRLTLHVPKVREIALQGSGDFSMDSLVAESLRVSLAGSGDMRLNAISLSGDCEANLAGSGDMEISGISCRDIDVNLAGSGDIEVSGTARRAEYQVAGSGDINARELKATTVSSKATGSGSVSTWKEAESSGEKE